MLRFPTLLRSTSPSAARLAAPRIAHQPVVRWQTNAATLAETEYTSILVSSPAPGVSLITLNRPKALNGTLLSLLSS